MPTRSEALALLAPGAQVVVRDEEWLIRSVQQTREDGVLVRCTGTSDFVRDVEASFFTELDVIEPLRPEDTRLVHDSTPNFRQSRLYIEALLRKTPLPVGDDRLAVGHKQLLTQLDYQKQPVKVALDALRPRLLIADSVGLGKTLEVGMLLSELIRRGRGDRILVVTPRHILEQFQHELWTRFAIPLVRLDSEGIQRVQQKIPASRNPFTYYKRAIISIDTLKNAGRYRHHLKNIRWDAVVIDECHNLMNTGTLNNELARVLAPNTDALILTSATPHNGKPESFAHLVDLLDPTAIADPKNYESKDIEHLYVRRHKQSPEVAAEVGSEWADRLEPKAVFVQASAAEDAVFDELCDTWLYPQSGASPIAGTKADRLFPWTLLKAFLSSHHALAETLKNRMRSIEDDNDRAREFEALERLAKLTEQVGDKDAGKFKALVETLTDIGIGPKSATRAVLFSERHATLNWLVQNLPKALGMKPEQIRVLHGGLSDREQQDVVEQFAIADSEVRVLVTGDIASEGVNLHRQCHQLIHFDLPWSLITIEQRNGRIDRYGQRFSPEIRALLLQPNNEKVHGDLTVLAKLLDKEDLAHHALGDAASLMGLHSEKEEESKVISMLANKRCIDEVIPDSPAQSFDLMMMITGVHAADTVATSEPLTLFADDLTFVKEALHGAFEDPYRELEIREQTQEQLLTFVPPEDLRRRLEALPQSYLNEKKVVERIKLTADRDVAEHSLRQARDASKSKSIWPDVMFLSSQHPVVDWLVDKVLVSLGRNEAPIIYGDVPEPTFLLQGMYSNRRGQAMVVEWMAIDRLSGRPSVRPMQEVLEVAGVHARMPNPGTASADVNALQGLLPAAIKAGRDYLKEVRDERNAGLRNRIAAHAERLGSWRERSEQLVLDMGSMPQQKHRQKTIAHVTEETTDLINALSTSGDPLVRVVGVLVRSQ